MTTVGKMGSDSQLFKILRQRFIDKANVIHFIKENELRDYFMVGLHLWLGNGEKNMLHHQGEGPIVNLNLYNAHDLLKPFLEALQRSHSKCFFINDGNYQQKKKTPLFSLATDSPKSILWLLSFTLFFGK